MNIRTLLLLSASVLLAAPGAAATDGTSVTTADACGIICCFQDNALDRAQCTGTYVVYTAAPSGPAGQIVVIAWNAAMDVTDVTQEEAQRIISELIGPVVVATAADAALMADLSCICCADNALDTAQACADFVIRGSVKDDGSVGTIVLGYWGATNNAIDVIQGDAQDIIDDIIGSSTPVAAASIVCEPSVLGETICYVAGIVLMPSYACTGMKVGTAYVQCMANAEFDHTERYLDYMCDTVVGPSACASIITPAAVRA